MDSLLEDFTDKVPTYLRVSNNNDEWVKQERGKNTWLFTKEPYMEGEELSGIINVR